MPRRSPVTELRRGVADAKKLYEEKGYLDAVITPRIDPVPDEPREVTITYVVDEGKLIRIQHIEIEGNKAFSEKELLDQMQLTTPGWFTWYTKNDQYSKPKLQADLEALRVVKKALGPDIKLMTDFNQGLSVAEAIRRGHMIDEEGGVYWIEEPVRADDFSGCSSVRKEIQTPIQIGENFMGPEQMAQALAAGASDYVMPDLERIGGVTGWMRAAALAQGAGVEMSSHLFPEASAHLLALTPTCHWLEYVDWADAILKDPLQVKDGFASIPDRPGTGIAWDEKAVKKHLI